MSCIGGLKLDLRVAKRHDPGSRAQASTFAA